MEARAQAGPRGLRAVSQIIRSKLHSSYGILYSYSCGCRGSTLQCLCWSNFITMRRLPETICPWRSLLLSTCYTYDDHPLDIHFVLTVLQVHAGIPETKISPALVQATFLLAEKLASRCQTLATVERPSLITRQQSTSVADVGPLHFACLYYGIEPPKGIAFPVRSSTRLLTTVLEDLLQLAIMDSSASDEESLALSHDISDRALATLVELLTKSDIEHTACPIQWDPASWIAHVLARVKDPVSDMSPITAFSH
jgi:hypothetical protein